MYSHTDIWQAIDRLAESTGHSPSGLAKKAGLDPTTFNKSKRVSTDGKPRWPSTESIAKILAVTGITMRDFFSLTGDGDAHGPKIPSITIAKAAKQNAFDDRGNPTGSGWSEIAFSSGGSLSFALEINNDEFLPYYRDGSILIVSPDADIRRGDRVFLRTNNGNTIIGEVQRHTSGRTELKSLSRDGAEESFDSANINTIARIMWVSQ